MRYPGTSINENSVGYSIASICVTPNGKIQEVKIINPIDSAISSEIIRVIKKSEPHWKALKEGEENQLFYAQVVYSIVDNMSDKGVEIIDPINKKYNFIEPIVMTAVSLDPDEPIAEPNDTVIERFNNSIQIENYEEALVNICELIKRNPFDSEYYKFRMFVNRKLGNNKEVVEDAEKIRNFIPGVSLSELLNKN